MELVINRCWGGAKLSKEAADDLGVDQYDFDRDDYRVIRRVKEDVNASGGRTSKLKVIEIPDECTDYMIKDYDGMETVIYVLNGKLYEV